MDAYPDATPIDYTGTEFFTFLNSLEADFPLVSHEATLPIPVSEPYRATVEGGLYGIRGVWVYQAFAINAKWTKDVVRWNEDSAIAESCEDIPGPAIPAGLQATSDRITALRPPGGGNYIVMFNNIFYGVPGAGATCSDIWPVGVTNDIWYPFEDLFKTAPFDINAVSEVWREAIESTLAETSAQSWAWGHQYSGIENHQVRLFGEICDPRAQKLFTLEATAERRYSSCLWVGIPEITPPPRKYASMLPNLAALALLGCLGIGTPSIRRPRK